MLRKKPSPLKVLREFLQYATLGLEMGLSVAVGVFIGYQLDRWLGTHPWLLMVFLLFGVAAGFKNLHRALKRMEREQGKR